MEELTSRRCTATNRKGEQCGRAPIRGGTVCILHGGSAPQVERAARLNLLELAEPAIARLARLIEAPPGLCEVCGRSDDTSAIVSAIRTVLDRCGLGPSAQLVVTPSKPEQPWVEWMTNEELLTMSNMVAAAKQRMAAGDLPPTHVWTNPHEALPEAPATNG